MNLITTDYQEVINEVPNIKDWIKSISNDILKKEIDDSKIKTFYQFGYFLPKVENKEEFYQKKYQEYMEMLFDDRLDEELSKVRVSVTLKIGNFIMSNRLEKGVIPKVIKDIVTEITKYKMLYEYQVHGNIDVLNSIPEFDESIATLEVVKNEIEYPTDSYDIDDILDKISESGMESLTDGEKEFLKNHSKNL
jgi:hypothetical protein